jgi:hypothetical protein
MAGGSGDAALTALDFIVASAAVGLCVLFTKRPEPQPFPPEPASPTAMTSVPLAPKPLPTATNATKPRLPAATLSARLAPWKIPDPEKLPDDSFGRSVRYGRDLIAHTSALIGPDAADPLMRYSGNGLECQSCHLDAGTRRFGLPLAGVWAVFPIFIGREGEVRTLEERINGCMERSMNGRSLPEAGPEMKAVLTYIRYISEGVPVGTPPVGRGVPALQPPDKASDPQSGAKVSVIASAAAGKREGERCAVHRQRRSVGPARGTRRRRAPNRHRGAARPGRDRASRLRSPAARPTSLGRNLVAGLFTDLVCKLSTTPEIVAVINRQLAHAGLQLVRVAQN